MMRHHLHMPSYFLGPFTEYPYLEVYILNPILGKNVYKKEKVVISTTNLR